MHKGRCMVGKGCRWRMEGEGGKGPTLADGKVQIAVDNCMPADVHWYQVRGRLWFRVRPSELNKKTALW